MQQICLDTGVLGLFFVEPKTVQMTHLIESINNKLIQGYIVPPVITEVFYHLCRQFGKDSATTQIVGLLRKYAIKRIELVDDILIQAGLLKCQHNSTLSYIDCLSIASCIKLKIPFHTTEKLIKLIPQNTLDKLKVIKYTF